MHRHTKIQSLALLFALLTGLGLHPAFAQQASQSVLIPSGLPSKDELQNLIQSKSQALEQINQQLAETKQNLEATKNQRLSLQQKLSGLQGNINRLNLNIQSDQLTSQKLALEIDSLNYDIRDIELSIQDKQRSVGDVLRELQKNDHQSLLAVFLKSKNLAQGLMESQSLSNLQDQLKLDVANLNGLRDALDNKLSQVSSKKSQIEVHKQNLAARKAIVEDQKNEQKVVLAQTKDKESLYQQQVAELEKQQNAVEDEIAGIEDQLRSRFNFDLLPSKRSGVLAWPIALVSAGGTGRITQHFGEKSRLYRGKPHNGMDIGVPIGTPVFAADDGAVIGADNNDVSSWRKYQYGKYIMIKHGNNLATLYAHLSRQLVSKGDSVKRGQLIGYSGNTGYSTGPHLHLGLYWAGPGASGIQWKSIPPAAGLVPVGVVLNPEDYL